MMQIKLDFKKSVEQNAEVYFERAKKLKKKLVGAKETIERTKRQLGKLEAAKEESRVIVNRKREWYEKFRWFYSSEGFLVIGGRDATTNEILIKKHTEPNDLVFHSDMQGSPFFVLKIANNQPTERTLTEVADAACSFSRAWKLGMLTRVAHYNPGQVSKHAPSGEYISKGAFILSGKGTYVPCRFNVAIGNFKGAVMAGPVEAIKEHCEQYVLVVQGDRKSSDLAKRIQRLISGELDEIIRALPSGGSDIKKL